MNEGMVVSLLRESLSVTLTLALPMLLVSLVVGLAVSLFQAVTQISETTLTFVPKLVGMVAVLLLFGPWMLHRLIAFTTWVFGLMPQFVH
jgi:flagellar biosynthesis protein FliQ